MRVQVTVVVTPGNKPGGIATVESRTLLIEDPTRLVGGIGRVVADTAHILAEVAAYGKQSPTSKREGGRG